MYNNSGSKVMNLATTLSALLMIIGAVIGVAVWIILMQAGSGTAGFFIGLIIFGLDALFAWILYLLLYAFGELVYKTSQIEDMLRSNLTGSNYSQKGDNPSSPHSLTNSKPITPKTTPAAPRQSGTITCPFCKKIYPAGTIYCNDCNAQIGIKH